MSDPNENTSGGLGSLPSSRNANQSSQMGRIGATSSRTPATRSSRGGASNLFTLRDLATSSAAPLGSGHGASDDDDDDGPEGNDRGENWYAGGERSGLSVENPEHHRSGPHVVRDILRKAAEAAVVPQPVAPSTSSFHGSGYTLGSDEVKSIFVPDPNAQTKETSDEQEVAVRQITFWRNGFSVEDGPLMGYDQPGNEELLDEINAGHAPPQFLNVRMNQPVELRVSRRQNEDYVPPPPRPLAAFEGHGHRLGSVVPEVVSRYSFLEPNPPGAFPQGRSSMPQEETTMKFQVDQTLPTTSVQVRFADGSRLVARMNLHHTVNDIRNFINASRPGSSSAPYTLQTPFPVRVLDDASLTIEQAGLKNSVVVQRMT